jgi:hypothetical protein
MKLDLLTNATVVYYAIRFVTEKGKAANAGHKTPLIKEEEQPQSREQESGNDATYTLNHL